jgi:hypothetical protein
MEHKAVASVHLAIYSDTAVSKHDNAIRADP